MRQHAIYLVKNTGNTIIYHINCEEMTYINIILKNHTIDIMLLYK